MIDKGIATERIISSFKESFYFMIPLSKHEGAGFERSSGAERFYSGSQFPFLNGVFPNAGVPVERTLVDLSDAVTFFSRKHVPFVWWWLEQSPVPESIHSALVQQGFTFIGDFLGIAGPLQFSAPRAIDPKITVRLVSSQEEYEFFMQIIAETFQLTASIKKDLMDMNRQFGPAGPLCHYLGYYEGIPVATLTTYQTGTTLGFCNGATLPQFQKHGVCSALAQTIAPAGVRAGCDMVVAQLMATAMAKGLSEKLGCRQYCRMLPFLKMPQDAT